MKKQIFTEEYISEDKLTELESRGYSKDTLPKTKAQRNMNVFNFFTLWMGSIHNIPNYAAIGGFLFLGLSPMNIIIAILLSSFVLSLFMVINGVPGSKYGIPFSMHLRSVYGRTGAKLPGFLRGVVAAISWFGLQNFTGSLALLVVIGNIWPGFLEIGGNSSFLGASIPVLISFTIFWAINLAMGFGGGKILNRFTAVLNPLIYIVFGGMTIWAIRGAGITNILSYDTGVQASQPLLMLMLMVINSVVAVWAAPGVSIADFTQHSEDSRTQAVGQTMSFVVGYGIFAISSIAILIGGNIIYGVTDWDVLVVIQQWDKVVLTNFAMIVLLMTTISTNATGNIIPAGYQLAALFPKRLDYKKGVLIAGIISYIIMPWKLMENPDSIFTFLNIIGATLGPVAGVMLVHYYIISKQEIDLDLLYMDDQADNANNMYFGLNKDAYIATIVGLVVALSGMFIPGLKFLSDLSWMISLLVSGLVYYLLKNKKVEEF